MTDKILVVGFPKAGTTTLTEALQRSGLRAGHQQDADLPPFGKMLYDGWYETGDPFAQVQDFDALTQLDVLRPKQGLNLWPNLDIALLLAIRRQYPGTRFILNARDPRATANSMTRWGLFQSRVRNGQIVGLPRGRGATEDELVRWIETHHQAIREIFAGSPNFLDLDIAAPDARDRLAAFLGMPITWWGVANQNAGSAPGGKPKARPAGKKPAKGRARRKAKADPA